jgi:large subunit ribosomal protein L6
LCGELMSRIGKKLIAIPKGIKVEQAGATVKVSGPGGALQLECKPGINVKVDSAAGQITVENTQPENRQHKEMHGTTRALLANMVAGAAKPFEQKMEIYGTGYNLKDQGGKLVFTVGLCNPVEVPVPKGIKVVIEVGATKGDEVPAKFTLSGADKCVLGQMASEIRKIKPPEPYKGKGIRYADEHIKKKVGKAFTSGAA